MKWHSFPSQVPKAYKLVLVKTAHNEEIICEWDPSSNNWNYVRKWYVGMSWEMAFWNLQFAIKWRYLSLTLNFRNVENELD